MIAGADTMSTRTQVELLLDLLDQAFQRPLAANWSDGWHSLIANLQSVRDEDWDWLPPAGARSISDLATHCGAAMLVYADYGFGEAKMQWPEAVPPGWIVSTKAGLLPWLVESHETLRRALAACTDDQLDDLRETWDKGDKRPRRWFATTMIEHILYHAGEINHIRALAQGND
jgi:hypothetical protein